MDTERDCFSLWGFSPGKLVPYSVLISQNEGRPNRSEQIHAADQSKQGIRSQEQHNSHHPEKEDDPLNNGNTEEPGLICAPAIKIKHTHAEGKQTQDAYPDITGWVETENAKDYVWDH
jgi:hypothetical protein